MIIKNFLLIVLIGFAIVCGDVVWGKQPSFKQFMFFYNSDCDYCHQMANTLLKLSKKHKLHIIAIGDNGKKIPQFPNSISDEELMVKFKIVSFPVLLAIDTRAKKFKLMCNGLESELLVEAKMLAWINNA